MAAEEGKEVILIPQGVRVIIYSYIDILELLNKIQILSQFDKQILKHSKILNQPKGLSISLDKLDPKFIENAIYAVKISTFL